MNATSRVCSLVLLIGAAAAGQAPGGSRPLGEGVGRRVASALENLAPLTARELTLDDLADAVSATLARIDIESLGALNADDQALSREEADLLRLLSDIDAGIGPAETPAFTPLVAVDDSGPEALERAQAVLVAQEAEILRLTHERELAEIAERARVDARRPTPLSRALLASLEQLPPATETVVETQPATTVLFPERIARALFRAGDWRGSLDNFGRVPDAELTLKDRYETARCQEELGLIDDAMATLTAAIQAAGERQGDFWLARLKGLLDFLQKSRSVHEVLKKEEDDK